VLPNFRFGTGETLPQLKLGYLTLGTPHRNAAKKTAGNQEQ
jgi:homoserine O-acetyltransferase